MPPVAAGTREHAAPPAPAARAGSAAAGTWTVHTNGCRPLAGRIAAGLGAAALVAHLWLLATHGHGPLPTTLFLLMSVACAPCIVHASRRPSPGNLALLQAMSLVMALAHVALALGVPGLGMPDPGAHTAHAGHSGPPEMQASATLGSLNMLAVACLELLVAGVAGYARRSPSPRPGTAPIPSKETAP